ncbi:MAG: 30S ribosomal protein S20 [Clostridia bacterium]|nr:30S ribosomal protein S20 [Clostridia bacterium]
MANIKSAKKRIKVINRQKAENKLVKATIATYTKKFRALVAEGKLVEAEAKLKETISLIDSAESKGVLHKNNASRKVARLTSALAKAKGEANTTETKVAEAPKKVEAKKEVVKEVVEEKPAKKTTTKKATTKKAETTEEKPAKKAPAKKATTKKAEAEEKPAKKTATKKAAAKKAE